MPSGGFIGFGPQTRSTGNAGAASIFLTPLVAAQNGTATAVLIDSFNANSSISFKALVYDSSHSALLASGSAVTSLVANYNRLPLTANLNVVAGTTYYVGYVCNAVCNVGIQSSGGPASWLVSGGQSVPSPANPLVGGASNAATLMIALELDGTASPGFGWGPDFASGVTRSVSNTVATFSAAANLGVRGIVTHAHGDGKVYAEIDVGGTLSVAAGVGLNTVNVGITQGLSTLGLNYQSLLRPDGVRYNGGISLVSYASGDTVGIAYDANSDLIWWNKNNGSWFGASSTPGDPVAGTGGASLAGTGGWPWAVIANVAATGAATTYLLRDTAGALRYTPPSGYSAWSSATFPALATSQARAMVLA